MLNNKNLNVKVKNNVNNFHIELIRNFQKNINQKQCEEILLGEYYLNACSYANQYIAKITYSNLVDHNPEEVKSYVYLAFRKSISEYKVDESLMSFRTFLYQNIKFASLHEIKNNFNWRVIKNYGIVTKNYQKEIDESMNYEDEMLKKINNSIMMQKVNKILDSKKPIYKMIWKLKCDGYKNKDISKILNLTSDQVKSKFQYIKKIILSNYSKDDILV